MPLLEIKASHKPIKQYYAALEEFEKGGVTKETSVRPAFMELLTTYARKRGWSFVAEATVTLTKGTKGSVDGAVYDSMNLVMGHWEAKDMHDDLKKEISKKFAIGYPQKNIIFWQPERAAIYQDGVLIDDYDLKQSEQLVRCLEDFFGYHKEEQEDWIEVADEFKKRMPDSAKKVIEMIEVEKKTNKNFQTAFQTFAELCRASINPNLADAAIEEMLVQHLLTSRLFSSVFDKPEFVQQNVIAREIENVITALASGSFNRKQFFAPLDHFYVRLENRAKSITNWSEKQAFINTVYEKFFQGFAVKVADTHGIVYTPQPIVDFMVRSVQHILKQEFGRSLADEGVHILDPFVGTGNFIMRIMKEIAETQKTKLPKKYATELHCNEVMLLPYYIASMNIEHYFWELTGQNKPFDGICLVDTFELAEPAQGALFSTENSERVERQKKSPIFVIIGNPPYNAGQVDENDNNKNRKYPVIDSRVAATYAKDGSASNKNALADPYVKAFRFASDRIARGNEGIVAFVSNNSFLADVAFDGMRKDMASEFDSIYVLDLGGNVRKNPKLSGTTHNVFGIQVGVSITLLIRKREHASKTAKIQYGRVDEFWKRGEKYRFLNESTSIAHVEWDQMVPDKRNNWLTQDLINNFLDLMPLVKHEQDKEAVFSLVSNGVKTNRDNWAFNFSQGELEKNMKECIDFYNDTLSRYARLPASKRPSIDDFVSNDDKKISWSDTLKTNVARGRKTEFDSQNIRPALYRPYCHEFLYFDPLFNERRYQFSKIFPDSKAEEENYCIFVTCHSQMPFSSTMVRNLTCIDFGGRPSQCFPFYTYSEDGSHRTENITDWALTEFRQTLACMPARASLPVSPKSRAGKEALPGTQGEKKESLQDTHGEIQKWDIFYYVYGLLHHPEYRTKYAANLRRELPRIPISPDFWLVSEAGKKLADLHVNYETQKEYPLVEEWRPGAGLNLRVEKMKLKKTPPPMSEAKRRGLGGGQRSGDESQDQTNRKNTTPQPPPLSEEGEHALIDLIYNQDLTLRGIPAEAFEYRLGNRSAIDWIIDQYQVSTDKRSGITNDPNRADDEMYIVSLIRKVVTVSVETVRIVKEIEKLSLG